MSFQDFPNFHRIILQDKKIRIPKKYVEKFWKGISNPIFLRFPNGIQKEIFWVENNGDIWFKKNWDNFAKFLKYGYLLTFKYIGGSYFKVKIFGVDALEIDYSNLNFVDEVVEATKEAKEMVELKDESEIPKQAQRTSNGKRKMSIDIDTSKQKFQGSSRGGIIKKAKKCSTPDALNERVNNENPSFEATMTPSYAHGYMLVLPTKFSREHLNNYVGPATIRVGEDVAMKVNVTFDDTNRRRSMVTTGWKSFNQKYNLEVGDVCKFVMTQFQPLSFTVTINRAREEPSPKKLQGYKEGFSCDNNAKRKGIKGTSRSCPQIPLLQNLEGPDVMKIET